MGQGSPAVRALPVLGCDDVPAFLASARLSGAERGTAGQAASLTDWIGRAAVLASEAAQPLGEGVSGPSCLCSLLDDSPDVVIQLDALDILSNVVKPSQNLQRAKERRCSRRAYAGRNTQPRLFAQFNHHPILDDMQPDGDCRLPTTPGTGGRGDLHGQRLGISRSLGAEVPAIKRRLESLGDVARLDVPVVDSSVHLFRL